MKRIGFQFYYHYNKHFLIRLKGPEQRAYYSERNGLDKPIIKLFGWRLFINIKGEVR